MLFFIFDLYLCMEERDIFHNSNSTFNLRLGHTRSHLSCDAGTEQLNFNENLKLIKGISNN